MGTGKSHWQSDQVSLRRRTQCSILYNSSMESTVLHYTILCSTNYSSTKLYYAVLYYTTKDSLYYNLRVTVVLDCATLYLYYSILYYNCTTWPCTKLYWYDVLHTSTKSYSSTLLYHALPPCCTILMKELVYGVLYRTTLHYTTLHYTIPILYYTSLCWPVETVSLGSWSSSINSEAEGKLADIGGRSTELKGLQRKCTANF